MSNLIPPPSQLVFGLIVFVTALHGRPARSLACDPNPDPLGLAGPHVMFINNCTEGTSIVSSNAHTREQAMNPYTPLRDPFGLRITDQDSKLNGATINDPVGDTVYIRGGVYEMPLITVFNRVVFFNEHNIKIKAYPNERVTICASSLKPGGPQPNIYCNPTPGQGLCLSNEILQFWRSNDVTVEGIEFVGNMDGTFPISGQNVTGKLCCPYVLRFWECNRLTLRDITVRDFTSTTDIGVGHRFQDSPAYASTEHMGRGLTVSYSQGLEMDRVRISCSADDPATHDQSTAPWDLVGFITECVVGSQSSPVRIHDCTFGACSGNAVELSTVGPPQSNVLFERNYINNWKNGVQVGGGGLSTNVVLRNNRITYNHLALALWGPGGFGIKASNCDGLKVINNVIHDGGLDGRGIQVEARNGQLGQSHSAQNTDILHNTLYHAGAQAISLLNLPNAAGDIPQNGITGTRVLNNLIYQINSVSALSANLNNNKRELFLQFLNFEENGGYGNVFHNNLFVPARSDGKAVGSADFGHWLLNGSNIGSWQCYVDPSVPGCGWFTCAPSAGCSAPTRYKYNALSLNALQPFAQNNVDATAADPMFANAENHDFHLVSGSPAINRALPLADVPTDFDGVTRAYGGGCTIGAYEFDPVIQGDLNCDFLLTSADISAMILALVKPAIYQQTYGCIERGDFNGDQVVNGRDLRGFVDALTP